MADKNPFEEFGGQEDAPAVAEAADPFAEFGGIEDAPVATAAPEPEPLQAGLPVPETAKQAGAGIIETLGEGARKVNQTVLTAGESLLSPLGFRGPLASLEAIPGYLGDLVTPGKEANYEQSFQEAEHAMLKRQEENMVGDTVGQFGQALVPVGAAAKLGQMAEAVAPGAVAVAKKIPGLMARYLLPAEVKVATVAGKVALGAGLGALENTAQGALHEIDESLATGDPTKLKERIAARAWDDFKTGAVFGGAISSAVEVAKLGLKFHAKRAEGHADVAKQEFVHAADAFRQEVEAADELHAIEVRQIETQRIRLDAQSDALTLEAQAGDELQRQLQAVAPKATPQPEGMARYVAAYEGHKQFKAHAEENVPKLKELLDVVQDNAEFADANLSVAAKNAAVRHAENGYGQAIRDPEVTGSIDQMLADVAAHKTDAVSDRSNAPLARLEKLGTRAKALIDGKLAAGDVGDAFVTMTDMNREIGRLANGPRGPVRDMARRQYQVFRALSEREDLWGEAAKLQKPYNAVTSAEISANDADAVAGALGDSGIKSAHDPFDAAQRYKGSFVEGHLKSTAVNTDVDVALRQKLAANVAAQSVKADLLGGPEALARAAKSREALAQAVKILDENAINKARAREWAGLQEDLSAEKLLGSSGAKGVLKDAASNGIAKSVGGGKLVDAVLGRWTKSQLERDLEAASITAEKASAARRRAAEQLANHAKRAQLNLNRAAIRVRDIGAQNARVSSALDKLSPGAVRAAITATLKDAEHESDPDIDMHAGPLANLTPIMGEDMAREVVAQRQARNAFLLEKAGPAPEPTPFDGSPERELADEDVLRLHRYKEAADDPGAAVDRIADGEGSPEDIETLQALYPQTLSELQEKAVRNISSSREPIPYERKLRIADSLGLPLTAELQPEALAFYQNTAKVAVEAHAQVKATKKQMQVANAKSAGDRIQ